MTANLINAYNAVLTCYQHDRGSLLNALSAYFQIVRSSEELHRHICQTSRTFSYEVFDETISEEVIVILVATYREACKSKKIKAEKHFDSVKDFHGFISGLQDVAGLNKLLKAEITLGWLYQYALTLYKKDSESKKLFSTFLSERIDHQWQPTGDFVLGDSDLINYFYKIRRNCIESNHVGLQASVLVWSGMFSEYCDSKTYTCSYEYTHTVFTEYYFKLLVSTEECAGHQYSSHLTLLAMFNEGNFTVLHNKLLSLIESQRVGTSFYLDTITGKLFFNGEVFKLKSRDEGSRFKMLLSTMMKNPEKRWSQDEIADDWGDFNTTNHRAVYDASRDLNTNIALATTVKDFICYEGKKTLWINDKYLR